MKYRRTGPRGRRESCLATPFLIRVPAPRSLVFSFYTFLFAIAFAVPLMPQSRPAGEYEVKAAFLYNFAKFVEWPPSTFINPKQPLGVCVFGHDPFGHVLEDALQGKSIGDHPVILGRAKQVSDLQGCQIVFVSASENSHLVEILGAMRGHAVLFVGDTEGFATSGGTIQFTLEDNRVHFTINLDAAERAGLKISSKLLALAHVVHDSGRTAEAKN